MIDRDLDVPRRPISPAPKRMCNCAFCGAPPDAVELLFRSDIGGEPPFICSACVEGFHLVTEAHRRTPELAAALVRAINLKAERRNA